MTEELIEAAKKLAERAHSGQKRKWTGTDYFEHPRRVAERVMELGGDDVMIAAAYLHDVLEDTQVTEQDILAATDFDVLVLVVELTNRRAKANREIRKLLDHLRLASVSPAAKFIKLIDRIDNLREMNGAPVDFQKLYGAESVELAAVLVPPLSTHINRQLRKELMGLAMDLVLRWVS